jgi:3-keto-5-aminohexanoate cleavage enzyme
MRPIIIAVAITGSVPRKKDNPAVPVTPSEQIESTHQAFEAGASLVHLHVRNPDESPSSDPALFAQVQEGVRKHCPGMIVQFSTGGRGRDPAARGSALHLKPDMASLATGSVNFPTIIYENSASFVEGLAAQMKEHGVFPEIEVFDLSHIYGARKLADLGLISDRPHVQFVMGIKNALPAEARILDFLHSELQRVLPNATWTAAGIGRHQMEVMRWVLERNGDGVRTGLEDNIRTRKDRLALSNAELVQMACETCGKFGRRPATPTEARALLRLGA